MIRNLFLVSLLCLAQFFPAALLAQTKKVEIDVITLKSGQVFKGEVEEKNDSFVRFKTENASRVYYMDDISSITKGEKEVPMTSEEKKQYKAQQAQTNKEKAKIQHEQNVELWKKRFPDYKRVTGIYADLSASLGGAVQDIWESNMQWNDYFHTYQQISSKSHKSKKFYWSIDAVIGYRFCPYLAIGAGGGVGARPVERSVSNVCGRVYPFSVKSTFLHCGTGSIYAEAKYVMEFDRSIANGGKFDFGYSFPLGKWLHLNTSFQFSLMGGLFSYESSYVIFPDGSIGDNYPLSPNPYKVRGDSYTEVRPGLSYSYCFRIGLEF